MDPAVEDSVFGRNAFLSACDRGNIAMVKYVAEKFPKLVNSVDDDNKNGLHLAAQEAARIATYGIGEMDTVVYLIEEIEMDPAVQDRYGRNSFLWACHAGHIAMVKYVAEKCPNLINSVDDDNNNGLHIAASSYKMDILVCLIEELKMDPAVEGQYGRNRAAAC